LGFSKIKQEDEGEYRIEIENEHGKVEHTFGLYVTDADWCCTVGVFRMKKKKKIRRKEDELPWGE